jgi:hypothetical protein
MIGATGVAHGERGYPQVFEGPHPGLENRRHSCIFLEIDAANFAGATTIPQLTMASEHWSRISRLLQQKKKSRSN